jgi:hypothetical protein
MFLLPFKASGVPLPYRHSTDWLAVPRSEARRGGLPRS